MMYMFTQFNSSYGIYNIYQIVHIQCQCDLQFLFAFLCLQTFDMYESFTSNKHKIRRTAHLNVVIPSGRIVNKGNSKITELRTILQRESQNS